VKKYRGALKAYSLALQISGTMVCSIFGSLFGGLWLDRKLGTTPWLMLVLMGLGTLFTLYTLYDIIKSSSGNLDQ
jgi:F0F1-type ATP synthase assembly protein I